MDLIDLTADGRFLIDIDDNINESTSSSVFNFSSETANKLIEDYLSKMQTIDQPSTIALLCLYVPVFLFSLTGNSFVIALFVKDRRMRRAKSLFLVNLALADEAVTVVCIPLVVGQTVNRLWIYGDMLCKLAGFMQVLTVASSIFTLTALSIDHYATVRSPRRRDKSLDSGQRRTVILLVVIWLVAAALSGPVLHVRHVTRPDLGTDKLSERASYCVEEWPTNGNRHAYAIFLLLTTYVGPIGVIIASYALIGRVLFVGEPNASAPSAVSRPTTAVMCSNNGICSRNGAVGAAGIGAACAGPGGDDCRGTLLPATGVAHKQVGTLHVPALAPPVTGPAQSQQQQLQPAGEVVFEVYVLSNRSARGGLLHPVTCSSYGYCHGTATSGGSPCTCPTLALHNPTTIGQTTTGHFGSPQTLVTSTTCGIQQPEELAVPATIGSCRGGCGLVAAIPQHRDVGSCSSSTTASSSSRKQRISAGAAGSASGDAVGGSAQSVGGGGGGQVAVVPRATSLRAIALHPAGCRYAAAAAAAATAAAGGTTPSKASVHDPVGRNRRAIVRLLVAIVVVFVASWLPYNVVSLRVDLNFDSKYARVLPFALWFGHAHSAVNPIVYWFFNKTFRNCLRNALQNGCRSCCKNRRQREARASQFV